jgi:hypothetical protein
MKAAASIIVVTVENIETEIKLCVTPNLCETFPDT